MTPREWSECRKKGRYRDDTEAKRVRRCCERSRGEPLRVYECPRCGGWHLTRVAARQGAA